MSSSKEQAEHPTLDPRGFADAVLKGVGQVFFQESAVSGALFVAGLLVAAPLMALGAVAGSAIGLLTAGLLKWDIGQRKAGIFGFNAALVGIASFFFLAPSASTVLLMVVGCVAATLLTHFMRSRIPFPTYTTPFIVITWVLIAVGRALDAAPATGGPPVVANFATHWTVEAAMHGVSQVMFQASLLTSVLFLVGIAVSNRGHAGWVLAGSIVGMCAALFHLTAGAAAPDPEQLVLRPQVDNIALGLYGYNATLAAVALWLWRPSFIAPVLGMLLTVPLTELFPRTGLSALTAPFVLSTWIVMLLGRLGSHTGARDSAA
jgi:urea transporter